jgi:putative phosphoribosyl transferase
MEVTSAIISEHSLRLEGLLAIPESPAGVVIFAHGSGSSRLSPRNQHTAIEFQKKGLATFLFDLLTPEEAGDRTLIFDIPLLAERLELAVRWVRGREECHSLPLGFFGASTGGGAALWAAANLGDRISAVVCRGGRPDLAGPRLSEVMAPTLLLVGSEDPVVAALNRLAKNALPRAEMQIIHGATHLFEEEKALEEVESASAAFFLNQFREGHRSRVA